MAGYFTYYINVWTDSLQQLHGSGTFKTKQVARTTAVQQLYDNQLPFNRAEINIMHYNARDYNDRNEPPIIIKPKEE